MTTLAVCDIQSEYSQAFTFRAHHFTKYLNKAASKFNNIVYFYNGHDTIDGPHEYELIDWLMDNGLNENTLRYIYFYDKGYGFLRDAMDNDIKDENIIQALREMKIQKTWNSDDLSEENQNSLLSGNIIYWNESFDILAKQKKVIFVGGGRNECLKELELGAKAVGVSYIKRLEFVY